MKNQLLLQTKNNYLNVHQSKSNINIFTKNIFNTKKTLILKSIRAVVENQQNEFLTEINTFDDPRYHTFNIYLIASNLLFTSILRNEILLNTYSIELPFKKEYGLRFHTVIGSTVFWFRDRYDGIEFLNTYSNATKYDYQHRIRIDSGLPGFEGKTGNFGSISFFNNDFFRMDLLKFDDGTPVNSTTMNYTNLPYPTVIQIAEWYNKFEPEDLDNDYNLEVEVENNNNEMTTDFTIEYRDLETNKLIELENNLKFPDMNILFEVADK